MAWLAWFIHLVTYGVSSIVTWLLAVAGTIVFLALIFRFISAIQADVRSLSSSIAVLSSLGIVGAKANLSVQARDYAQALARSDNGFWFLGVGAEKLTREPEFLPAMMRCSRKDRPIRFLLAHPDHPWLSESAARMELHHDDYRNRVRKSLGVIREAKEKRGCNVEVKFYSTTPTFRVVVINEDECLLGFYVDSTKPKSDEFASFSSPHLVVMRGATTGFDDRDFLGAVKSFFSVEWERSTNEAWDFKAYL
jgi:hypothetical protein